MKRISTKTNIKPQKIYIKDLDNWKGKSVGIVLSREDALLFAEGLIKGLQEADKLEVTIFPKVKTPIITITYLQ